MAHDQSVIDARGMRCPWPVLRLAKAMRAGEAVTILADDPVAPAEIAALAASHGWNLQQNGAKFLLSPPIL